MTRVCVVGACGRMGEAVRRALSETPGLELGGALELPGHPALSTQLEGGASCDAGVVMRSPRKGATPATSAAPPRQALAITAAAVSARLPTPGSVERRTPS